VGLVLAWPIFDGTVSGREDAQRAREDQKREELRATEYANAADIRRAYVEIETARSQLASLDRATTAARQNYDQASAQFAAGLGNAVDVAQASLLVVDAETGLAVATFQLARARAQLGRLLAEDSR
jgi:outer membrane protein TolC